jgi:aminoglycoside phosphotransferase (APT) family kinase protein
VGDGADARVLGEPALGEAVAVTDTAGAAAVARPLLDYLRAQMSTASLEYAAAPTPISGGFDTAIYGFRLAGAPAELSEPLILRVFRDGGIEPARFETVVQSTIAGSGYPAPAILVTCLDPAVLGGAFVIMPRVRGRVMLDALLGPGIMQMATLMGKAHAQLHALDPEPLRRALDAEGMGQRRGMTFEGAWGPMIEEARLDGLQDGYAWTQKHRPVETATAICHGDFHPLNVMVDGGEVSGVLDWSNARIEDPAWDVRATMALFGYAPADMPSFLAPFVDLARGLVLRRYLRAYRRVRAIDANAVRFFEATRLLGFLLEAGMVRQARAGVIPPMTKATAFEQPRVLRRVSTRFEEISGVQVSLPAAT